MRTYVWKETPLKMMYFLVITRVNKRMNVDQQACSVFVLKQRTTTGLGAVRVRAEALKLHVRLYASA